MAEWQYVPVEATEEMVSAAKMVGSELAGSDLTADEIERACYRTMLGTAPSPAGDCPMDGHEYVPPSWRQLLRDLSRHKPDREGDAILAPIADVLADRAKELLSAPLRPQDGRLEAALLALATYEQAFDSLFAQCCSNPIKNAWGQPVDMSLLNEAHAMARRVPGLGGGVLCDA